MGWTKERFEHECHKFDPLLRVRRSYIGDQWLIERKASRESRGLIAPKAFKSYDLFTCARDGYIHVMSVPLFQLNHQVFLELRAYDMWTYGGAGPFADYLEEQERLAEERKDRDHTTKLMNSGGEAYENLAWDEGRRVGMAL